MAITIQEASYQVKPEGMRNQEMWADFDGLPGLPPEPVRLGANVIDFALIDTSLWEFQ